MTTEPEKTNTADEKKFSQAELDAILKDRLQRERDKARSVREAAEAKAAEEALKQQGEFKALAEINEKKAKDLEAKLAARELADRKLAAARKAGLPDALAPRLAGEDETTLEADARALAESLPKPGSRTALGATNPGSNSDLRMTAGQYRDAVFNTGKDIFNPHFARSIGGGVFEVASPESREEAPEEGQS